jgi:chaperonin cofactor prefoldin
MATDLSKKNNNQESQASEPQFLPKDFQAIIAGIFPNTRYFDTRFDLLQVQIDELRRGQESIKEELKFRFADVDRRFGEMDRRFADVDRRFGEMDGRFVEMGRRFDEFKRDVDKRFEQVDKRFEQVDKRFEQVDKRFEQIIASIDRLADKLEHRDKDQRNFTLRMFSISIAISIFGALGAFLKTMGVF